MVKVDKHNRDGYKPQEDEKGKFVTVFVDASHCPDTKAWGVGIWIMRGINQKPKTYVTSGIGLDNSFDAEMEGIYEVIRILSKTDNTGLILSLQCDCIGALNKFSPDGLERQLGFTFVKFKHVKAHTSNQSKRSKTNYYYYYHLYC